MEGLRLRGITWEHRRAIDPLVRTLGLFGSQHSTIEVEWTCRPLSGFEFTSVAELAKVYDLIILDHPFAGAIAESSCLIPLDDIIGADQQDAFVGSSLESYRYAGRLWAIPVDAACQVAVSRPDLMAKLDRQAPTGWDQVLELGQKATRSGQQLAIGLRGVHSLMTFLTLCANLGSTCSLDPHQAFADPVVARRALALMRELVSLCPRECLDWDSIGLHEAMVARDDLAFCPAVYGYAPYAEQDVRHPLRFHNFPGPAGHHGSTLGGTGLGISAKSKYPEAAKAYARFAASRKAQFAFARHHGQPAMREVWDDSDINSLYGNCYFATRSTIEQSWIRPRYDGYIRFQEKAGSLVETHLRGSLSEKLLLDKLQRLHAKGIKSK
jgi:multiple sugar transport system substrate-binding protein